MTALAFLPEMRVAFSDVMISVEAPGSHMTLPSTGYTGDLLRQLPLSPTGMVRKFFRLPGQIYPGMFLVAGTLSHIRKLVENVDLVRKGLWQPDEEDARGLELSSPTSIVHTACLKTEADGFPNFEVLGMAGQTAFVRNFNANCIYGNLAYYGELFVAGSGGQDLYHWLAERGQHYATRPLAQDDPDIKRFRAINSIPLLLLEQDRKEDGKTIANGVGGYYEAYVVQPGELEPVGRVLSVIASIRGRGDDVYLELECLYYHRYVGDFLLVISLSGLALRLRPGQPCSVKTSQFNLFEIPSLLEQQEKPDWAVSRLLVELSSAAIFRMALTRHNSGAPITIRFSEGVEGRRLLHFEVRKNKVVLSVHEEAFAHYLHRFPSTLPEDNQPIGVYW